MPPNAATPEPDAGVLGDLDGFGMTKGREAGTPGLASNPREATARALTETVLSALSSGDLVAALAATRVLEAFVQMLGNLEPQRVPDLRTERAHRGLKGGGWR